MTLDQLIDHRVAHLARYQDAAYAHRYTKLIADVRQAERQLLGPDAELKLTCKLAMNFSRLMSYKDEYEVARLYTDGHFRQQLEAQFEGDFTLEFHMAPPLMDGSGPPRKRRFGPWMMSALRLLAKGKGLRGSWFDVFGRTQERRMERALIAAYEARIRELLPQITRENYELAIDIAAVPEQIRGFGKLKHDNASLAREREAALLHRFNPAVYPRPETGRAAIAGHFKGIPVNASGASVSGEG